MAFNSRLPSMREVKAGTQASLIVSRAENNACLFVANVKLTFPFLTQFQFPAHIQDGSPYLNQQSRQIPTDMATGQSRYSLRLSSQVILGCVKLTTTTNHTGGHIEIPRNWEMSELCVHLVAKFSIWYPESIIKKSRLCALVINYQIKLPLTPVHLNSSGSSTEPYIHEPALFQGLELVCTILSYWKQGWGHLMQTFIIRAGIGTSWGLTHATNKTTELLTYTF